MVSARCKRLEVTLVECGRILQQVAYRNQPESSTSPTRDSMTGLLIHSNFTRAAQTTGFSIHCLRVRRQFSPRNIGPFRDNKCVLQRVLKRTPQLNFSPSCKSHDPKTIGSCRCHSVCTASGLVGLAQRPSIRFRLHSHRVVLSGLLLRCRRSRDVAAGEVCLAVSSRT